MVPEKLLKRPLARCLAIFALACVLVFGCACTTSGPQGSSSTSASSSSSSISSASASSNSSSTSKSSSSASTTSSSSSASSSSSSKSSASSSGSKSSSSSSIANGIDYSKYPKIVSYGTYTPPENLKVEKSGSYTSKDEVALYIHTYGKVPSNYISKTKARKAGWVAEQGNLWKVLPGMSIGGGGWNNDDAELPWAKNRNYFECDIDYSGGFRNAKRIVYSDDGLIFYTDDHYETFEQLY